MNPLEHTPHPHELAPDQEIRRRVKGELRKRMRGLRKTTPLAACLERSQRIVERLLAHDDLARARAVALFWPIEQRHEVDLRALDAALRARGVALFYPAIEPLDPQDGPPTEPPRMTFRRVLDVAQLAEAGFGFAEPGGEAEEASALDVVVVPALGIAPSGHRIGYGAGYYDRTLPRFAPPAVTLGVAYDFQLLAEVPVTPGDVALDWIVTDARVLRSDSNPSSEVARGVD